MPITVDNAGYFFEGPTNGLVNEPSDDFTVTLSGEVAPESPVTITPTTSGTGTFTPASVEISTGSPSATFTYTPDVAELAFLSVTNNGDLIDPADLRYTSQTEAGDAPTKAANSEFHLMGPAIG